MTDARITKIAIEALRSDSDPAARVSKIVIEVARTEIVSVNTVITQMAIEVGRTELFTTALLSQTHIEVARREPASDGYLTSVNLEVARRSNPKAQPALRSWMVFDDIHSVDVLMISGEPPTSAVDDLEVMNGANVALLGQEIIQWRDATDLGDNRYRLSRLLRGRLGTELYMNSHTSGDVFIILDADSVRRVIQTETDLNVLRHFKIVGKGLPGFSAPVTPVINTGMSQKPWQSVNVLGTRDGSNNLTITWVPRTRVNIEWLDLVDAPIGEAEERYEIDVLGSSGTVVRTLTATTPTVDYSAADQTTDFGSAQAVIPVIIYKMSNVVGRGHPARALV